MIRLHIIAEGQTEETFVRNLRAPHLGTKNISVDVRCLDTSRNRTGRGDVGRHYHPIRRDIQRWLLEDQRADAHFTTMIDLHGFPRDMPAFDESLSLTDPYARVRYLERKFAEDIGDWRFIPYIQLHEFEALILSDPTKFDWMFIEHDREIDQLVELNNKFENPEIINDGYDTAPSRRIAGIIPEYASRKASAGPLIAEKIGLSVMRARCPHFNEWLTRLEGLAASPDTDPQ